MIKKNSKRYIAYISALKKILIKRLKVSAGPEDVMCLLICEYALTDTVFYYINNNNLIQIYKNLIVPLTSDSIS